MTSMFSRPLAAAALLFCIASCSSSIQAPDRFFTTFWTDVDCQSVSTTGVSVPGFPGLGKFTGYGPRALCSVMVVEIRREWAPLGVDRFYELVNEGFFNNSAFFRVAPGFVVQFGVSGTHDGRWKEATIHDDPSVLSNKKGTMAFAMAGAHTRTTEVFVSLTDNSFLDNKFAAFGTVVFNLALMRRVLNPTPGHTDGVDQDSYLNGGNAWLAEHYPNASMILGAAVTCAGDACDFYVLEVLFGIPRGYHVDVDVDVDGAGGSTPAGTSADSHTDPRLAGASTKAAEASGGGEAEAMGHTPGEVAGLVVVVALLFAALAMVAAKLVWKPGYAPLQTFELGINLYEIGDDDEASDSGSESDGVSEASYGPSADVSFDELDPVVFDEGGVLAIDGCGGGGGGGGGGTWPTASAAEQRDDGAYSHAALQSALDEI